MSPQEMIDKFLEGVAITDVLNAARWKAKDRPLFEILLRGYALGLKAASARDEDSA